MGMHPLEAFFPHTFDALPIVLVRPAPRWDDEDAGDWDAPGAEADDVVELEERDAFDGMPGE